MVFSSDIDFVIDKKLELDLWNNVFKTQINYFQTQIRENSSSSSSSSTSSSSNPTSQTQSTPGGVSTTTTSSSTVTAHHHHQQLKKLECQAKLSLFLESARGFYTRLLEDILLKYELTELGRSLNLVTVSAAKSLSRHQDRRRRRRDDGGVGKSGEVASTGATETGSEEEKQLKQLHYICHHILTHLG